MAGLENVLREVDDDGILTVTVDRPEKMNALNHRTIEELKGVFADAATDDDVRGVILTGTGDKAFVAGADIEDLSRRDVLSGKELTLEGQELVNRIEGLRKPVVAAVNGYALGGGCELALACHLRYASENARLGLPEVKLGIIPGFGGTQRLPRLVGKGHGLELILTGEMIPADEARRIGLVNEVLPPGELLDEARDTLRTIAKRGPLAIRYAIEAVNRGLEGTTEAGLAIEADLFGLLCGTEDMKEGTTAFLEKREPEFQAR